MNLAEVRENLRSMETELEMFRYLSFLGKKTVRPLTEIYDRFSDIFSHQTIKSLQDSLGEEERLTEIERKAREVLLNISRNGYLRKKTREISAEIDANEKALSENGSKLGPNRHLIALYKEKIAVLNSAAKKAGVSDICDHLQNISGVDARKFEIDANYFVRKTVKGVFRPSSKSRSSLAKERSSETVFQGRLLKSFFRQILENFDFPRRNISQINVKSAPFSSEVKSFSPDIPNKSVIFYPNLSGVDLFASFLFQIGAANQNAWTSADLYSRYPEFVHPPVNILRTGYGVLFESLLEDEGFMRHCFRIEDETSLAHLTGTRRSKRVRQIRNRIAAMKFNREILSGGVEIEEAIEKFESEFKEMQTATDQNLHQALRISFENSDQNFLRGALFGYGLREYFRSKYDFDWWKVRSAFEELIDFWNTASRYQSEELARLIGFETNFEFLAETLS